MEKVKKYSLVTASFLLSLSVLLICTKSSPLYPMNDWVDVNCFFTMGKGLLHGLVPYVDLYEQKGPVLYFIYALVTLISDGSFLGVFLLELASMTMLLYYTGKILGLYAGDTFWRYPALALLALVVCTNPAFCHGGSVEEISLGLMAYGLYILLRSIRNKTPLTLAQTVVCGIFAGMVFWIKFTMAGFFAGLALSVAIWYALGLKDWLGLLKAIGGFLAGVLGVSLMVLLYFWIAGGLDALYTCYFYNNLFLYPSESEVSKSAQILDCLKWALHYNPGIRYLLYAGGIWLAVRLYKHPMELVTGVFTLSGLVALTYWGGKGIMQGYGYYDLVLAFGGIFGLCGPVWLLSKLPAFDLWMKVKKYVLPVAFAVILAFSSLFSLKNGRNVYLMEYEKEDMPPYQFAQIIRQKENPTLLNYGFLDGGFYLAADVLPNSRFFCNFNVAAPDMWESQWKMLWAGEFDFVVTRRNLLPSTFSKYELVAEATFPFEGYDFTYYLYAIKE